ncbi:Enoyl-CoA hydratase/carnithine racemase [Parasphingorhabdus marina DSM 22363]|uniref:Enoyl-CoA hydratase/carnithine racemase n=1 Tax=Parasphingorhabdus marina DSM 22363 TaxID=1123272 RepID=A0A1N6CMF7_9SPHN|nr:enoyl-CoA hydratase-related protein [Parasphingorhabdus marina]SIN59751.1 Enoyl-CoA hydratase/carnithine racemase [Parasphingorhabdus marina DSM 22363]
MTLRLEKDGKIAHLLIDRPDKRNAFTQEMWELFPELLADAMADDGVRVLTVHSSRKSSAFCAGADIGEFGAGSTDPEWRARNQAAIGKVQHDLAQAEKPTIAVIDGDCIGGGCGIALACDIRIAGPAARFGITPAKLGLVYPLHDTKLLVDAVGPSQAKRILFTGQILPAEEALRIGLITQMSDDPYAEADALAETMATVSSHSQKMSKQIIRRILDGQADDDAASRALFDAAFESDDFREGVAAFLEKRKPEF